MNNARYLEFLGGGALAHGRGATSLGELLKRGLGLVVAKIEINYRRPAVLDDVLRIVSEVSRVGGRSAVVHQRVLRGEGDAEQVVAEAT